MATLRSRGPRFPSCACLGALTVTLGVVACGNDYSAFRVFSDVTRYEAVTGTGGSETAVASGGGGAEGANGGAGGGAGANGNGGAGATGGAGEAGGTGGRTASTGGTGTGGFSPSTGGASTGGTTGTGGSSPGCAGILDSGICWYYGGLSASCATTCATHGGSSPQAPSHVGIASQGGSLSECTRLLGLLGMTGTVNSGTRSDGQGVGCHVFSGAAFWWLSSPAYSETASLSNVRIVCGCVQ
jgi:hypothetical protein